MPDCTNRGMITGKSEESLVHFDGDTCPHCSLLAAQPSHPQVFDERIGAINRQAHKVRQILHWDVSEARRLWASERTLRMLPTALKIERQW